MGGKEPQKIFHFAHEEINFLVHEIKEQEFKKNLAFSTQSINPYLYTYPNFCNVEMKKFYKIIFFK